MKKIPIFIVFVVVIYFIVTISKYGIYDCKDNYTSQGQKNCIYDHIKQNFSFNLINLGLILNLIGFLIASFKDVENFDKIFFSKEVVRHAFWFNFIGIAIQIFGLWLA